MQKVENWWATKKNFVRGWVRNSPGKLDTTKKV